MRITIRSIGIAGNVRRFCEEGQLDKAVQVVSLLVQQGNKISINTFAHVLQECIRRKSFTDGKLVYSHIVISNYESNLFLGNILVHMYASCGEVLDAHHVFSKLQIHNVFSWTAIIAAYANQGQGLKAIKLFQEMRQVGVMPDKVLLLVVLKACTSLETLEEGKAIHAHIIEGSFESDIFVGNSLIYMYGKSGSARDACEVFRRMHELDSVSWDAVIAGHSQLDLHKEVLLFYEEMQGGMFNPNRGTFVSILKACASLEDLERGKLVHAHLIKSGCSSDIFVGSTLVYMYAKCRSIENAIQVFENIHKPNVVSWNAMIAGHAQQGLNEQALSLFEKMQQQGVKPDQFTFVCVLKACTGQLVEQGKQVHVLIIKQNYELDVFVGSTLVDMYAKCGSIEDGRGVFNKLCSQDMVLWTAMITGYSQQGCGEEACELFEQMQQQGIQPDEATFVSILKACASPALLERTNQIHAYIINGGFESNISVGNALVEAYMMCGCSRSAHEVFSRMHNHDVVSWTALISGYSCLGLAEEALQLYEHMQNEGVKPDQVTFVSIIKACSKLTNMNHSKKIHVQIINSSLEPDPSIESSLVDMYARCGSIEHAGQVFNQMFKPDLISYTTMIEAYTQEELGKEALRVFQQMLHKGVEPDEITYVSILRACGSLMDLEQGNKVHKLIIHTGVGLDISTGNALINMYVQCKCINDAHHIFNKMDERNVGSWTAIITGHAQLGLGTDALTLFKQMQNEAVLPNHVTFVSILKACSSMTSLKQGNQIHAQIVESGSDMDTSVGNTLIDMYAKCGSIEKAHQVFSVMSKRDTATWTAMIAGYAQQGLGNEALKLFKQMQADGLKPDTVTFVSVLSACSHAGLVDEGCYHFVSISQGYHIRPTMEHYACVVDLLGRAGLLSEAECLIQKTPINADATSWMALLGACRSHGNVELGRNAFECVLKLEPKCIGAYVLLSNIFATAGSWDELVK